MTQDNQKRLILYVADVALGDKRCDVEQLFRADARRGRSGMEDSWPRDRDRDNYELDLNRIVDVLRDEPFHIFDHAAAFDENELRQVLKRAYDPRLQSDSYSRNGEYASHGRDAEERE